VYSSLKKVYVHKLKYTSNRGFKDSELSVVLLTNLVPLFTVWGGLLLCFGFLVFLAELLSAFQLGLFIRRVKYSVFYFVHIITFYYKKVNFNFENSVSNTIC